MPVSKTIPTDPVEIQDEINRLLERVPEDTNRGRLQHLVNALMATKGTGGGGGATFHSLGNYPTFNMGGTEPASLANGEVWIDDADIYNATKLLIAMADADGTPIALGASNNSSLAKNDLFWWFNGETNDYCCVNVLDMGWGTSIGNALELTIEGWDNNINSDLKQFDTSVLQFDKTPPKVGDFATRPYYMGQFDTRITDGEDGSVKVEGNELVLNRRNLEGYSIVSEITFLLQSRPYGFKLQFQDANGIVALEVYSYRYHASSMKFTFKKTPTVGGGRLSVFLLPNDTPKPSGYLGMFSCPSVASPPMPREIVASEIEASAGTPIVGTTIDLGRKSIDEVLAYLSTYTLSSTGTAALMIWDASVEEPAYNTICHYEVSQNWVHNASHSCSFEVTKVINSGSLSTGKKYAVSLQILS